MAPVSANMGSIHYLFHNDMPAICPENALLRFSFDVQGIRTA